MNLIKLFSFFVLLTPLTSCELPFEIRLKSSPSPAAAPTPTASIPAVSTPAVSVPSVTPTASTTFSDVQGIAGETEIQQLAQLGVFEGVSDQFNPQQPITRAEFIRWLVRSNNAIYKNTPEQQVRLAESGQATFPDVPATHPDFRYIQGMLNSGFAVGYEEKTFRPDQPLTREEMIAIKSGFDSGGVLQDEEQGKSLNTVYVPNWSDRNQISRRFYRAFNTEYITQITKGNELKNVDRTFGAIKAFRPKAPVTRAEAALCMSVIGDRGKLSLGKRSVQEAL
ncbi:S-layer protein [Leptolyngbya sp. NIES-3755]|nr:S-layer protein [Leptolyngbya sp. NIES-3755]